MPENRRRDREYQQTNRTLEFGRKEFATKDDVQSVKNDISGLKSTLTGIGILGIVAVLLAM